MECLGILPDHHVPTEDLDFRFGHVLLGTEDDHPVGLSECSLLLGKDLRCHGPPGDEQDWRTLAFVAVVQAAPGLDPQGCSARR